jgi:para-nitrobenzyl esterase
MRHKRTTRLILSLLSVSAAAFVAAPLHAQTSTDAAERRPIAIIRQGKVLGQLAGDGSTTFQGIPYAQPPVGKLRWRDPEPPQPWAGLRDGTKPAAACMQMDWKFNSEDAQSDSEDCLYLNIATPSWPATRRLPVLFWIHGGANYNGSGRLWAQTLTRHGVVLVSINYRLGVFGFLAHPDLTRESRHHSSGNYGILDQIAALQWVQQNIAAFGGDPSSITIAGQSAGAIDVGALIVSPLGHGLFSKAIDESGGPIMPQPILSTLSQAENVGTQFAASAGGDIQHLRSMSAPQILEAANRFTAPDAEGVPTHPGPSLSQDGWILPDQPAALVMQGKVSVPLLIGSNVQEFSFTHSSVISNNTTEPVDKVRAYIQKTYGQQAPKAIALYGLANTDFPEPDPLLGTAGTQLMTDIYFRCPATITVGWLARAGKPAWQYQFEQPLPGTGSSSTRHSGEVPYVFGAPQLPGDTMLGATFGPADAAISRVMQAYWTSFVKTGSPNSAGLPDWPQFKNGSEDIMHFTPNGPTISRNKSVPLCHLYQLSIEQRLADTKWRKEASSETKEEPRARKSPLDQ